MHIVIIRLSALGDVLTASPIAGLLRRTYPDARLTWVIEDRCADLVVGNPHLDDVIALPSSRQWRTWWRTDRRRFRAEARAVRGRLRELRADVVLDIHGLFKTAVLARAIRAPRKIRPSNTKERVPFVYSEEVAPKVRDDYITSMYVSLAECLGATAETAADYQMLLPVDDAARAAMAAWRGERGLAPRGYVAVAPGTTWPQKHWVAARWAPTLDQLHAQTGLPAVLLGGPAEQELCAGIAGAMSSPVHSAVGATKLLETGALLETAALCLTVDTGPMHMAVAVGCPTVAIYGPTPPRLFGPEAAYRPLYAALDCAPCFRHPTCDGRFDCQQAITPEMVVAAGLDLLAANPLD